MVEQDDMACDPRKDPHVGIMVCWHQRYKLGDEQPKYSPAEWKKMLACSVDEEFNSLDDDSEGYDEKVAPILREKVIMLPLFLMDHSGLSISTRDFNDRWDSGQIGWIYVTRKSLSSEGIEDPEGSLRGEVEEYDRYLRGDMYGFVLEQITCCECCGNMDYEDMDSCWGFGGDDIESNGMLENISEELKAPLLKAWKERV
jgi:hypothetical protein